jgi:hypothetical protein
MRFGIMLDYGDESYFSRRECFMAVNNKKQPIVKKASDQAVKKTAEKMMKKYDKTLERLSKN